MESNVMTTTSVNTIDAKEQFTDIITRVAHNKESFILTRRGKDVAVIISVEDFKLLKESQDKYDLREAIEALKEARQGGTIPIEQFKTELSLK